LKQKGDVMSDELKTGRRVGEEVDDLVVSSVQ